MTLMYKTILLLSGALLMAAAPARVAAQSFDTSGTAGLSGPYLFRYVNFFNDGTGNLVESCSLTGVMTFDGKGNYTLSNTQLFDSLGTGGAGDCASLGGGTYGVQSNASRMPSRTSASTRLPLPTGTVDLFTTTRNLESSMAAPMLRAAASR